VPQSMEESPMTKKAGTRGGVSGNGGVGETDVDEVGELVGIMKSVKLNKS
jgi:hypothetical protein